MVPMLTCGLVRSNFAFATGVLLWTSWFVAAAAGGATLVDLGHADWPQGPVRAAPRRGRRGLLPGGLGDDLLRDVPGNLRVGVELHRVARPALGLRPQVA